MKKIAILTAGGDAPGMNAAIRAAVRIASGEKLTVIGIKRGYRGLYEKDFSLITSRDVSGIINLGGTILKTIRFPEFKKSEIRKKAAENLKEAGIEGLIAIGGNGTAQGALLFHQESGIPVVVIPASIDNDLGGTDMSIGFDTAVNTAVEAIDRIRDTATSHERTFVIEVMGRHCGNLALEVGLACGAEIIVVPEVPLSYEKILEDLREADRKGKNSVLIVLAEGVTSAPEMTAVIKKHFPEKEVRYAVLGYIQRGGSPTYATRVLATRLGAEAVRVLISGASCHLVGVKAGRLVHLPVSEALATGYSAPLENLKLARLLSI